MDSAARQVVPGYCGLCRSRCGARFVVEGGRLAGVEPWPGHPTGGALCAKGRAAPELQVHPDRLTRPLRRTTPRTDPDPRWEPVSWDEAMADIAARLARIRAESGAHAVAFSCASPGATALSDSLEWIERLIFAFGSPNFLTGVEICNWYRDHSHAHTFGSGIGIPDYPHTDLVLLWGFNPGNVWLAQASALAQARARGAKLVVIDPVRTRHAAQADLWLQVKPGTDAALALGIARELMALDLHDEGFLRAWTNAPFLIREDTGQPLRGADLGDACGDGFVAWDTVQGRAVVIDTASPHDGESLALEGRFDVAAIACRTACSHYAEAMAPWTPEAVEAFTGVPADKVREAARLIGAAHAVSHFSWTGIAQHANATQADRAIALLYALTGDADAPGGNRQLRRLPAVAMNDRALLPPERAARVLGLAERPLGPPAFGWVLGADFHRAAVQGQPYRVRALVGFGANVLMSQPDTAAMREALQALEFQVHVDVFETPTARHADYLLPAQTPWEREGLRIGFEISPAAQQTVQLRPAAVAPDPASEARADLDIVFDLAVRLGHGDLFFGGSVERGWAHQLAPLGLSPEALRALPGGLATLELAQPPRAYADRGFPTASRRVEIYSARLAAAGLPPVPGVEEARPASRVTLGCAKSGYYCQSQHRGVASLRAREPLPQARLHPDLAAARGIAAGDAFEVFTSRGAARFIARLDPDLQPGLVLAGFGHWQGCADLGLAPRDPLAPGHANMNALLGLQVLDPAAGSAPLRSLPCDVRAVAGPRGWNGWQALTMRAVSRPAVDVIEFALARGDGLPLPDFRPGQHVTLALDLPGLGRCERSYSFIGASHAGGHAAWRIAVRRGLPGGAAHALHAAFVPEGAWMAVQARIPAGRFLLPVAPARPTVLMAAGIGITPFLALLETMRASPQPVLLLYGNRDAARHAFVDRIAALAARLQYLTVIDRYSATTGRIGVHAVPDAWLQADARYYLCGPPAMLAETRAALRARGVPRHAVFWEAFDSGGPIAPAVGDVDVHFARSGRRARWSGADANLLAFADRLGVALAGGCRIGQCESCRVRVLAGRVHHLGETDVAEEGDCLACIAVPDGPLEIDA